MVGGLLVSAGAHLGDAALGGLEDLPHLLGRGRGQRRGGRVRVRLELVRNPAQVLIDGGWVVASATHGEVATLDLLAIHDRSG